MDKVRITTAVKGMEVSCFIYILEMNMIIHH